MKKERGYIQVERLLNLARTLTTFHYGFTLEELVENFRVNRRTIYRDLRHLEHSGFPIERYQREGRVAYKLREGCRAPNLNFSLSELMALRLSKNQLRYLQGTAFKKDFDTIYKKIEAVLSPKFVSHLEQFERIIFVHPESPKDYHEMEKEIGIIQESLRLCRSLKFVYHSRSRSRPKEYEICPYGLVSFRRGLYLLAQVPEYDEIRCFALDSRLKGVQLTAKSYVIPESFSLSNYTQSAFGIVTGPPEEVKVEFSPTVAPNVAERIWHRSQEIDQKKDGRAVLTMFVAPSPELSAWVLSFGSHARVIKPGWLREGVKVELSRAARRYS